MVTYMEPQTVPSYMSATFKQRTLAKFHMHTARITVPKQYSQVRLKIRRADPLTRDEPTRTKFSTSPQNQNTKLTHCSIYMSIRTILFPQTK